MHYNKTEKLLEFETEFKTKHNEILLKMESDENELRNKQEKEMQEANINNLPLDLIVNRHISELDNFIKEKDEKIIQFRENMKDTFHQTIEAVFANFLEAGAGSIVYNAENKPIELKLTKPENLIRRDINNLNEEKIFDYKISFGLFNRTKLHIYFFKVKDHINHQLKLSLSKDQKSNTNSLNEIFKESENFGENIFAGINFFNFNNHEKKITHSFDLEGKIQNEFFYEHFNKFFSKVESQCKKGNLPNEFDIITTKHTAMKGFDILINIFITNELDSEKDINIGKDFI